MPREGRYQALRPTPCEARNQPTLARIEKLDEEAIEKTVNLFRRVFRHQQAEPRVRGQGTKLWVDLLGPLEEIRPNGVVTPTLKQGMLDSLLDSVGIKISKRIVLGPLKVVSTDMKLIK